MSDAHHPGVAQLVARLTGGQEAVSSSLATRTKGQVLIGLALFYFAAREKEDIRTDAKALNSLMIPRSSKKVNPLLHIRTLFQCYGQLFAGNLVPFLH